MLLALLPVFRLLATLLLVLGLFAVLPGYEDAFAFAGQGDVLRFSQCVQARNESSNGSISNTPVPTRGGPAQRRCFWRQPAACLSGDGWLFAKFYQSGFLEIMQGSLRIKV